MIDQKEIQRIKRLYAMSNTCNANVEYLLSAVELLQSQLEQLRAENEALRKPRMFPIQRGVPVRWELAEKAYATYSGMFGTDQSLQRLAERGGFGVEEFACLYLGHDPRCKSSKACVVKVEAEIGYIARLQSRLAQVEQERDELRGQIERLNTFGESMLRRLEKAIGVGPSADHGWEFVVSKVENQVKL